MTSIILYQVPNSDGIVTNQWLSTDAGADYYEPSFGTRAWTEQVPVLNEAGDPLLDDEGAPLCTSVEHPATYQVVAMDITGSPRDPRMIALRSQRNTLLVGCDWTQIADAPLTAEQKAAWAAYRQALRGLPENTPDPANPAWPAPPGGAE